MKVKKFLPNVIALSLLACANTHAATECLFTATSGVDLKHQDTITLDLSKAEVPDSGYTSVSTEIPFTTSQNITSTCNNGPDGQTLQARNTARGEDMKAYTTIGNQQVLMYKTGITGLYYGVKMINGVCSDLNGYLPPDESFTDLIDIGDDREKECMKNDTPWQFSLQFFIGPDYKYITGRSFHSAITKTHGIYRLSGSIGDAEARTVSVKTVQINGVVK